LPVLSCNWVRFSCCWLRCRVSIPFWKIWVVDMRMGYRLTALSSVSKRVLVTETTWAAA